jgi:methylated-DNA-[protein]-cysteine S-methyltransferase
MTVRLRIDHIDTPIDRITLVVDEESRLCAVGFHTGDDRMDRQLRKNARTDDVMVVPERDPAGVTTAFRAYFAGELAALDDVRVVTRGTPFQESVWKALREIPCGETWSYGDLAKHIGRPTAVRAVGLANGANPVGIVIPCHRVIGSDGSLTGYGGGVDRKRWLLAHEQRGEARAPSRRPSPSRDPKRGQQSLY